MKKVYYLCFFDIPENAEQNRNYVLAATTKSKYVTSAIAEAGCEVEIVSASATRGKNFCKGSVTQLDNGITLRLFDSEGCGSRLKQIFNRNKFKKRLKTYLLENVTSDDVLVVYHSLYYMDVVKEIKAKKNPKLIFEANEVYSDVLNTPEKRDGEIAYLSSADAFILSTELLGDKINGANKPYAVNYGTYETPKDFKNEKIFSDGKIHIVYAGVLEPRKGAGLAVESALYLDKNYHIHIIGFGSERDTEALLEKISEVSKKTECAVSFDGKFSGDDYLRFLQSCDIGLAPQNPDAKFNETSFPSKVLSYLSNGLRVVSIRIKAIESSKVNDLMYYFNENTPESLAKTIKSIDFSDGVDSFKKIKQLDTEFIEKIKEIIE